MPGYLLHLGATVLCSHGGQAQPTSPNPRVLVGGLPVVTQAAPYAIAGCPFVPPAAGPCVTAQWVSGALRVRAGHVAGMLHIRRINRPIPARVGGTPPRSGRGLFCCYGPSLRVWAGRHSGGMGRVE